MVLEEVLRCVLEGSNHRYEAEKTSDEIEEATKIGLETVKRINRNWKWETIVFEKEIQSERNPE